MGIYVVSKNIKRSYSYEKQDKTIIAIGSKSVYYHHTNAFTIKSAVMKKQKGNTHEN
jgi:hypothetical protein